MLLYEKNSETYFEVKPDDYAENPREGADYNSTFVTFERDYSSPDENSFKEWDDMLKHFGVKFDKNGKRDMYGDLEQLQENALKKGIVIMPVWKYEHSGLAYRAADRCPFPDFGYDSGLVGVIYEKRNRRNIEEVRNQLKSEVDEYSQYANGDIYEVIAYDKDGEVLEGIGGFYADYEDEKTVVEFANDYMGLEITENNLEEIHYERDYMPVDIDPDLVDDEYEYEDMEYRSLTIEERIAAHQEYLQEYAQDEQSRDEEER